jgi:hypothetical protein
MIVCLAAGLCTGALRPFWEEILKTNDLKESMKIFLAGSYSRLYVHDEMQIYLAGNYPGVWGKGQLAHELEIYDFNILESFYYIQQSKFLSLIPKFKRFMLDSGAFTFMRGNGEGVNWNKYVDAYANFINDHEIDLFIEMDIDAIVGLNRVNKYRRRIEQITGKQPIPVLHRGRGKKYWDSLFKDYKYIAVPTTNQGLRSDKTNRKMTESILPYVFHQSKRCGVKIHGLGYTPTKNIYPFDSVDSSAWLFGNRSGFIYKFNGKELTKIKKPNGTKLKSRDAAVNNFIEWVKYSKYTETK